MINLRPGARRNDMTIRPDVIKSPELLTYERVKDMSADDLYKIYAPPRTLGATDDDVIAMDSALREACFPSLLKHAIGLGMGRAEIAPQFLGYPYLAGLSQNTLIRRGVTIVAEEMVKKWVEVTLSGKADPSNDRVRTITQALEDFGLREIFNEAAQKCDFDGGCLVYIDMGLDLDTTEGLEEAKKPLYVGTHLKGKLKKFRLVEAINLYPGTYNASDPLKDNYFEPETWLVLGKEIHKSRFLYFAPNKPHLLLRPAYNFFGIPAAQLVLDFVAHFTKTREAAQRLMTKFSTTVFKTNMTSIITGGATTHVDRRIRYFTQKRDNDGVFVIDMQTEDVVKLETPLSGVSEIVTQGLEYVAMGFGTPSVKYIGMTPGGMNATGAYDERSFNEHILSKQEKIFRRPINTACDVIQCHLYGDIDRTIKINFIPLSEEDKLQRAQTLKLEAEVDAIYMDRGALGGEEVRQRLADRDNSGYNNIDVSDLPPQPGMEDDNDIGGLGEIEGVGRIYNRMDSGPGRIDIVDTDKSGSV